MATDESNSSDEKLRSVLIQSFCKERVPLMSQFLDHIMVRYTSIINLISNKDILDP